MKAVIAYHSFVVGLGADWYEVPIGTFLFVDEEPFDRSNPDILPGLMGGHSVCVHVDDYTTSCHPIDDVPPEDWDQLVEESCQSG